MSPQIKALAVHLFTATGAVFAMLAMLAAVDGKWDLMFVWLVVAFLVDGIDGPLARHYHVKKNAPQFDGVLLDLIIDYLTYVFIPAFALFKSGLMDGWSGWLMIIIITFASAMYFADTRMKTKDNSFSGFPGCWNMVVLVLFALAPRQYPSCHVVHDHPAAHRSESAGSAQSPRQARLPPAPAACRGSPFSALR